MTTTRAATEARLAAQQDAAEALAATSTTELLRKAYALTHRIHEATATVRRTTGPHPARQTEADLRAARDLIDAELLRRTGEL